ncbi:BPSL0067 family protein [Janthinobacterium sp. SUN098]|uniref:BPSL0067 family protein n=1 Tax=Janthinobacterium sp. SUN098 TaxID=3002437 RepID=UPI0038D42BC9
MSYTYTKVADLEKTAMVGNRQCVALVSHYAGAPATLAWKQDEAVRGNRLLRKGTAIATFGECANQQQGNHAALYMGQTLHGICRQEIPRYSGDAGSCFSMSDATAETTLTMPAIKNANR